MEDTYKAGNPELSGSTSLIIISGCSGSGKSTLLAELAKRGYAVRPEAGRQIVKEQQLIGGTALPWQDMDRFAELSAYRAAHHFNTVRPSDGTVFFDRSIIDVVSTFQRRGKPTPPHLANMFTHYRYHRTVLMSPPWPEIFQSDRERQHGFEEAANEYDWLLKAYNMHNYETIEIPIGPITDRADFVEKSLPDPQ